MGDLTTEGMRQIARQVEEQLPYIVLSYEGVDFNGNTATYARALQERRVTAVMWAKQNFGPPMTKGLASVDLTLVDPDARWTETSGLFRFRTEKDAAMFKLFTM